MKTNLENLETKKLPEAQFEELIECLLIDCLENQLSARILKVLNMRINYIHTISLVGEIDKYGDILPVYEVTQKYNGYSFKFYIWNDNIYFYNTERYLIVYSTDQYRAARQPEFNKPDDYPAFEITNESRPSSVILESFNNLKDAQDWLKKKFERMVNEYPLERMRDMELSRTAPDGTRSMSHDGHHWTIEIVDAEYLNSI